MIIEYIRPHTIREALILLAREQPMTYPLGGGTFLNRGQEEKIAVVDLQALRLKTLSQKGNLLQVGAMVTLQELSDFEAIPEDLRTTINHEATYNLRQMATIAGTLVTASGRSPFATTLLALDTSLEVHELGLTPRQLRLGDWFPLRDKSKPTRLVTRISFPINVHVAYEYIARTPADQPIICAGLAQWPSGRTRLVLGGWGESPILALDGPDSTGIEQAAKNAYSHSDDEWASAEYRQQMAMVLARRALQRLNAG
jgi:CO/xanthine dehydrogenase FAD-binding subunit